MKQSKHLFEISGLLKWLTKSILVVGLIAFSGHASESMPSNFESTKTELNEVRKVGSKRTFNLKKVSSSLQCSFSTSTNSRDTFTCCLHHQENKIAVKLKNNFEALPINEQNGFLIFHSTKVSEEFDTNYILG